MGALSFYRGREALGQRQRRDRRNQLLERLILCVMCERDSWPTYSAEWKRWDRRLAMLRRWR